MAFVDLENREINCKIVFVGAVGAGKTENLKSIFQQTSPEVRAGLLEFDAAHHATRYFDFLPISMGHFNDYHLKLHLFTLPVHQAFENLRPLILRGIDAYILVVDSRLEYLPDNIKEWQRFKKELTLAGQDLAVLPGVIQYNKRDCGDILSIAHLRQCLNEFNLPEHEAVAAKSIGPLDTLNMVVKKLLEINSVPTQPSPNTQLELPL